MNNQQTSKRLRRDNLPNPLYYYAAQFPGMKLKHATHWISVLCCFHDDTSPSLRLNLHSGGFICFACGIKGGDVIAFHRQRYGLSFVATLDFFQAWGEWDE